MRAYSVDLRQKILLATDAGMSISEAARVFHVGQSTIKRYKTLQREQRTLVPKPHPGRPPNIRGDDLDALRAQVLACPDATLEEHCLTWERSHGVLVSNSTMSRGLLRLGMTRKKKMLFAGERDEEQRAAWRDGMAGIEAQQLVFVDETAITIAMTRRYGRAPKGQRATGSVPRTYGKSVTLIAALSLTGVGAVMTLEGAADATVFETYVRNILAPTLRQGQIVVADNVTIHKGLGAQQVIEERGCELRFLPPYSSDFCPVDLAFSKIKQHLRSAEARSQDALVDAVAEAVDAITIGDAQGYFRHCGYEIGSPGDARREPTFLHSL
jgi:transposase